MCVCVCVFVVVVHISGCPLLGRAGSLYGHTKLFSWFTDPAGLVFHKCKKKMCKLTISGCGKYHVNSTDHMGYLMSYITQYGNIVSMA